MLFVKKKDGSLRICIEYRQLNNVEINNNYTIHRIDDLFDHLQCASHLSKMDLQSGYHKLRATYSDILKTTFKTWFGSLWVCSYVVCNTNAFAGIMDLTNRVFKQYFDLFVIAFIYDILIYSRNKEEHVSHWRVVLQTLKEHQLFAKFSKCEF